jgi:hypothetical protein
MFSLRCKPVYNSLIAEMRSSSSGFSRRTIPLLLVIWMFLAATTFAADWAAAEQELARKIVAATGPGAIALDLVNRSSLNKKAAEEISRGLRTQLESLGLRAVKPEQAAATVAISLSENLQNYVWLAEIHQGAGEYAIVMTSISRQSAPAFVREPAAMTIRKIPLWVQEDRILDVAVLEESSAPTHIAVLDAEKASLYRLNGGNWQLEQALSISHANSWPRDMRGRLLMRQDHLFDVYLPGVFCQSSNNVPLNLTCRKSDDPWPLSSLFSLGGFYAPTRNFFTGVLSPGVGKQSATVKFYSAAPLQRANYILWLFAGVDGQSHLLDGVSDQSLRMKWGSDVASVKTSCGSGWQVLATQAGDSLADSVRAYELPDRDPLAVSEAVDFAGGITALWTEAKGGTAVAVSRNSETGNYEAFRLSVACGQ